MDSGELPTYRFAWDASQNPIGYSELWGQQGAFTTMRLDVKKGSRCAYFLENHVDRLCKTLVQQGIQSPFEQNWIWREALIFLAGVARHGNYLFRIAATANNLNFVAYPRGEDSFQYSAAFWEYNRSNPSLKTLDYQDAVDILNQIDRSAQEVIIVDDDGYMLEGITSNLIFAKQKRLYIPQTDNLQGLTIQHLIPTLQMQFEIIDEHVNIDDLDEIDEIIICGSGKNVAAVAYIPEINWEIKTASLAKGMRMIYERSLANYRANWRGP